MHNIADISLEAMQIKRQSTISLNDLGGIMNYLILYTTKIFFKMKDMYRFQTNQSSRKNLPLDLQHK